jgi:two-component system sensor kinase FixL
MAGLELRQTLRPIAESMDLQSVLEELRIVIEASFHDSQIVVQWENPGSLPRIWADRQTLLQAFLNIAKNSQRVLEQEPEKCFRVRTSVERNAVIVRFFDTGPGIASPESLFAPFQPGAQATGLGLYLSRTFVRAFDGDIEFEPQAKGCCFAVILALAADQQHASRTYLETAR